MPSFHLRDLTVQLHQLKTCIHNLDNLFRKGASDSQFHPLFYELVEGCSWLGVVKIYLNRYTRYSFYRLSFLAVRLYIFIQIIRNKIQTFSRNNLLIVSCVELQNNQKTTPPCNSHRSFPSFQKHRVIVSLTKHVHWEKNMKYLWTYVYERLINLSTSLLVYDWMSTCSQLRAQTKHYSRDQ